MKGRFYISCFAGIFVGMLEMATASGLDRDAHAKSAFVKFSEGISVRAELDSDGDLSTLRIDLVDGTSIEMAKEDLAGLKNVDLQTLKVRVESATIGDVKKLIFAVTFEYGLYASWYGGLDGVGKLYVRPCVRFVFVGNKLLARYRAVPLEKEAEWMTFAKLTGKPEGNEGVDKRRSCPFSSLGLVEFLPLQDARPSGAGHE